MNPTVRLRPAPDRRVRDEAGAVLPADEDTAVAWSVFWERLADAGDVILAKSKKD